VSTSLRTSPGTHTDYQSQTTPLPSEVVKKVQGLHHHPVKIWTDWRHHSVVWELHCTGAESPAEGLRSPLPALQDIYAESADPGLSGS